MIRIMINITRKELKKLFLFATSQIRFIFNSKFYNQIDGVVMGSPLPLLTSLSTFTNLSGLMNIILTNLNFIVDDILAAFDNEQDSLNNRHPHIKFTTGKQIKHSITFLDVFISYIKISHFKYIANRPIQDFSYILRVLHRFNIRLF